MSKEEQKKDQLLSETILPKKIREQYNSAAVNDRKFLPEAIELSLAALTAAEEQARGFKEERDREHQISEEQQKRLRELETTLQIITEGYGKYISDMEKLGFTPDPISVWLNRRLNG